MTLNIDYF